MRGLLREPLVHFLLGGAALFALYGVVGAGRDHRPDRIVVDDRTLAMLSDGFRRTWARPPSEEELQQLVDDHVEEEILYREARALGLDVDDVVVRRRMRQKMDLLARGAAPAEPDDAVLRAFAEAHPERFRAAPRLDLVQVFVAPDAQEGAEERAAALLERLRGGADPASLGDATFLPSRVGDATPAELSARFGEELAAALEEVPVGSWTGPIRSTYGLHLVKLERRTVAGPPPWRTIRDAVARDWRAEQEEAARRGYLDELRQRYQVEIVRDNGPGTTATGQQ